MTARRVRAILGQARIELLLTIRRGESLLVSLVIPIGILLFFSKVDAVNTIKDPVDFLVPGVLALAVMSTAMVSLGIATGYERRYGVLKRLGSTPLSRSRAAHREDAERARDRGRAGDRDRRYRHRVGLEHHGARGARDRIAAGRHGRVRRHRAADGGNAARRSEPRRGQRAVPRAVVPRRHGVPAAQAPRRVRGRRQGPARRRARPRACAACCRPRARSRRGASSSSRSGRSPPRSSPSATSAGRSERSAPADAATVAYRSSVGGSQSVARGHVACVARGTASPARAERQLCAWTCRILSSDCWNSLPVGSWPKMRSAIVPSGLMKNVWGTARTPYALCRRAVGVERERPRRVLLFGERRRVGCRCRGRRCRRPRAGRRGTCAAVCFEQRELLAARVAPRGPEVHDAPAGPAAIASETLPPSSVLSTEVGRGPADLGASPSRRRRSSTRSARPPPVVADGGELRRAAVVARLTATT